MPPGYMPPGYPPHGYMPPFARDGRTPCRRAGILMLVAGSLMMLCGGGFGMGLLVPFDELFRTNPDAVRQLRELGDPQTVFRSIVVGFMAFNIAVGLLLAVLGVFVYRCSQVAATLGTVLMSLLLLMFTLMTLGAMAQPQSAVVMIVPIGVSVWLLVWLVGAMRAASRLRAVAPAGWINPYPPGYGANPYPPGYGANPYPPQQPPQPQQPPHGNTPRRREDPGY